MRTIAHIVNPVKVGRNSDLFHAQPITFETMRRAKELAKGKVNVELYTTQYAEDRETVPPHFLATPDLERSVLDLNIFDAKRKLPLIADILQRLHQASAADYFIYTNVDIAVMPQFYEAVDALIGQGHDAFIINRRRVPAHFTEIGQIPLVWSQVGKPHPGFDCFVFKRELYGRLVLENICVGIPYIGIAMAHNLFCFADNFRLFQDLHLTIHIGMEVIKKWGDEQYLAHNRAEFAKVRRQLMPLLDITKFPYYPLPFYRRYASWLFNPAMQIGIAMPLEWKRIKETARYRFNEFFLKFVDGF